jgi:hypothetical protein
MQLLVGWRYATVWVGTGVYETATKNVDRKLLATVICWFLGLYLFIRVQFAAVYCILSMIGLIFINLGTRAQGEMSAYSVFNKGFRRMLGTLTADQFDREIRHRGHDNNDDDDEDNDGFDDDLGPNNRRNRPRGGDNNDLAHRKVSGKKARRGYEKKLQRRQLENQHQLADNEADFFEADEDQFME